MAPRETRDFVQRIARQIAQTRVAKGLTQEALALSLEIATKNVQRLESGKQNLTLRSIERVALALEVAPESFFKAASADALAQGPHLRVLAMLAESGYKVRAATESGRKPRGSIPVLSLRAAAGKLGSVARSVETLGWAVVPNFHEEGAFIAQVRGTSMVPRIPDGALCLFRAPGVGSLKGRTMLVEHHSLGDANLEGPYALKRIGAVRKLRDGRTQVTLLSDNARFAPIEISFMDEDELKIIGELVRVL